MNSIHEEHCLLCKIFHFLIFIALILAFGANADIFPLPFLKNNPWFKLSLGYNFTFNFTFLFSIRSFNYVRQSGGSIQEWGLIQYDIWTKLEIFGQSAIHTVERSFQLSRPSSNPNFLMMKRLVTLFHFSENDWWPKQSAEAEGLLLLAPLKSAFRWTISQRMGVKNRPYSIVLRLK